jgi:ubiquinol-cytochrome c reductase cytochrome c1 subunit
MIRILSLLVGLAFSAALAWSFLWGAIGTAKDGLPVSVEKDFHKHPKTLHLASDGLFGHFDRQQLQRGYVVYRDVCSSCHSLKHVAYRDLAALGFNEGEVKAIAKAVTVSAPDPISGEIKDRPGLPSDYFPPVTYAGLGHPPDLSLITKARHGGAPYVYSLVTGYTNQVGYKNEAGEELLKKYPEAKTGENLHFNPYFANLNLAMAPPLHTEGQVTWAEGNPKATVDQMAQDVSAFLVWTAEPTLEKRHQTGWAVLGFLIFATILAYFAKQQIWAGKKDD